MDTCPACNATFSELTVTGLCPACDAAESTPPKKPSLAIVGLVFGALPFVLSAGHTESTTVTRNGEVIAENVTGIDYIALGGGGLAAAIGVAALVPAIKTKQGGAIGLSFAALGLGLYQLARGLYLF